MQVIFERIRYQNIMSVGQVPVDVQLNEVQQTLITGKNGAAKSTMLEAIYFALFGKPFRDINKGQLINSVNKKNMLCELWFTADSNSFYVKRGQKPNVLEVTKNGEKLDEVSSVKDFQSMLESMIGMNGISFKQTSILGTAGYTPFMQLALPQRRALIEDLLEVSILGEMDKLNKSYLRELTQNIASTDSHINHLTQQITTHQDYIAKQKQQASANTERYNEMLAAEKDKMKGYDDNIQQLTEKMDSIVVPEMDDSLPKWTAAQVKLQTAIQNYNKVINLYSKGGNCPTCSQALTSDISGAQQKVTEYTVKLDKVSEKLVQLNQLNEQCRIAASQLQQTQQQIQLAMNMKKSHEERCVKIIQLMQHAEKEVVIDYTKLDELKEKRASYTETKSAMVLEKYNRGFITEMLKDKGIKASIIKKYIPFFNKRIKHYLDIMGADYSFVLDESFQETIKSRGRESFSYMSFSQGEKARIDISLLFTWIDVAQAVSGSTTNLLVLDEVFDGSFDQEGVNAVRSIMESMKNKNIYIISHREHDTESFGRHIKMVKKGRFSVME